jgi:hypothetical protein
MDNQSVGSNCQNHSSEEEKKGKITVLIVSDEKFQTYSEQLENVGQKKDDAAAAAATNSDESGSDEESPIYRFEKGGKRSKAARSRSFRRRLFSATTTGVEEKATATAITSTTTTTTGTKTQSGTWRWSSAPEWLVESCERRYQATKANREADTAERERIRSIRESAYWGPGYIAEIIASIWPTSNPTGMGSSLSSCTGV